MSRMRSGDFRPTNSLAVATASVATADDSASWWRDIAHLKFGGSLELKRKAEREIFFLLIVCFVDMMTTLWWVETGRATEANPFLQWTFHFHPVVFVLVKLLSVIPACLLALRLAQRYPDFTTWLLRMVLAAYVFLYFGNIA